MEKRGIAFNTLVTLILVIVAILIIGALVIGLLKNVFQ